MMDWDLLTPEADELAGRVATSVARQYERLEWEDLHQEARIILCSNPGTVRGYIEQDSMGHLNRWLWERLTNKVQTEGRHLERNVSFERELERYAVMNE